MDSDLAVRSSLPLRLSLSLPAVIVTISPSCLLQVSVVSLVASLIAVGERSECGSCSSYCQELTPPVALGEEFIVPQLQPIECAKKQLVVLELQMNTTQTVPRLHLALAQLFGEPNQYSIIGAVFRVTGHERQPKKSTPRNSMKANEEAHKKQDEERDSEQPPVKRLRSTTKA